jgi:CheY-like chemotaxis protein
MSQVPTTVLVVDDHPTFRRFARQMLEEAGYAVVGEAADGAGALARVQELAPEVVLLDVLLPDISGLRIAAQLAALPQPPVVVLTSSRSAGDLGAALTAAPARGFVPKSALSAAAIGALVGGRR